MLLHQRFIPGLAIASYLVGDERTGEAAVIGPTRDVEGYADVTNVVGGMSAWKATGLPMTNCAGPVCNK